jgi:hypothetical protein
MALEKLKGAHQEIQQLNDKIEDLKINNLILVNEKSEKTA